MDLLDNKTNRVVDKLKSDIKSGSEIAILSSEFTIFAYDYLKLELNKAHRVCFLFSNLPDFTGDNKVKREFELTIPISGNMYEIRLKNTMCQTITAKECAEWIRNKVSVKRYISEYPLSQKMYIVQNKNGNSSVIVGSADFTSDGLGIVASPKIAMNTMEIIVLMLKTVVSNLIHYGMIQ